MQCSLTFLWLLWAGQLVQHAITMTLLQPLRLLPPEIRKPYTLRNLGKGNRKFSPNACRVEVLSRDSSLIYYSTSRGEVKLQREVPNEAGMMEMTFKLDASGNVNISYDSSPILNLRGKAVVLLGLFRAGSISYVGLVTNSTHCESIPYFRKVKDVLFLPLGDNSSNYMSLTDKRELELLYESCHRHSFHYSSQPNKFDITKSFQENDNLKSCFAKKTGFEEFASSFKSCDLANFWNIYSLDLILRALRDNRCCSGENHLNAWITPVASVVITSTNFQLNNHNYSFSLISRRSWKRLGPRLRMRGIDKHGAVANFVETEQLLCQLDTGLLSSFVQVRGSLPLYWKQVRWLQPKPRIVLTSRNLLEHISALRCHLNNLLRKYEYFPLCFQDSKAMNGDHTPSIVMINLIDKVGSQGDIGRYLTRVLQYLGDNESDYGKSLMDKRDIISISNFSIDSKEQKRTEFLENEKDARNSDSMSTTLRYIWFDFNFQHTMPNSNHFSLLRSVADVLQSEYAFYARNDSSRGRRQSGIIRTNCVDSLDRTNVVQSAISRYILTRQIRYMDQTLGNSDESFEELFYSVFPRSIETQFKKAWIANGDKISVMYSGTSALKQDFVKHGRQSVSGLAMDAMTSAKRYYLNLFKDSRRLRGCNILIGKDP